MIKAKVSKGRVNINNNNKYKIVLEGITGRFRISIQVRKHKAKVTRIKSIGGQTRYNNSEQRHEARLKSKRDCYYKKNEQYKKDTDKTLTDTLRKDKFVKAVKEFYSEHYQFNYLWTPQSSFQLDKHDGNRIKDKSMFEYARQQDKYQIKKDNTLDGCIRQTERYLDRLTKNGKPIYDNYYYCIHKSHYTNSYHAHILLNITDTSIVNPYTYLKNRTKASKYQKRAVKKVYNVKEMIGYLNEEYKRNNGDKLNVVYQDCNMDRNSLRVPNGLDLTVDLEYSLKTFVHPVTQILLKQYGEPQTA